MLKNRLALGSLFLVLLIGIGCGGNRLESIQVLPVDPTILNNNTVYATPGGVVQYQIQAQYTNQTVSTTIPSSQGHWSSTQPNVATVDSNGLVTSVGPVGVTTIVVTFNGQRSTTVFGVCTLTSLCPPTCDPTSCP
jgi:Bacterial Ig-like domain (group 2)